MKILITGAAGYLGSILCAKLIEHGHSVKAIDRNAEASAILASIMNHPRFEFIPGDVRDRRLVGASIKDADVLIPLAALVGAPKCDQNPEEAWTINFEAIELLNCLRRKEQRVLFPMTNNGYQPDADEPSAHEETRWNEGSLYTRSKKQAEELLLQSGNSVSLRLASLYGISPAMRWDLLVHTFVHLAVTQKRIEIFEEGFKRSFLHARDAAEAFCFFVESANWHLNGVYNAAREDANISKLELAQKIQKVYPETEIKKMSDFPRDPDTRDFFISAQKLRNAGFEAKRPLEQGITELLASYPRETVTV